MALLQGKFLGNIFAQEVPSGTTNGTNKAFTLVNTPHSNASVLLYLNGLIQRQTVDYTISGKNITFTVAPQLGQSIYTLYVTR